MASTIAKVTWLTFILRDIGVPLYKPPILRCDNMSALYMTINPVFHGRTKHIEMDYHYVQENVASGTLITKFMPSDQQLVDIFTKPLARMPYCALRIKLGLWHSPQPSLRGTNKEHGPVHA